MAQDRHRFDLQRMAQMVTAEWVPRALRARIDLGMERGPDDHSVPHPPIWIQANELLMREALSNLIDNALHHGPVGTRITVRVGPAWVEVVDDGPGIAPEHQAHVFERFFRAAPSGVSGSGLGLAIVKEIANQHGAQVQLQSPVAQGHGTAIRMSWPEASPAQG